MHWLYLLYLLFNTAHLARSFKFYPIIKEFSLREHVNPMLLFHCGQPESEDLFKQISEHFTGSLHSFDFDSHRFFTDHSRLMTNGHFRPSVLADLSCPKIENLLEVCSENAYFNASYRWLFFSGSEIKASIDLLKKQNLNIDSRVTIAVETSEVDERSYEIYEIYGTIHKREGKIHVVKVGSWSSGTVNWTCSTNSYKQRNNLEGITLWSNINVSYLWDNKILCL